MMLGSAYLIAGSAVVQPATKELSNFTFCAWSCLLTKEMIYNTSQSPTPKVFGHFIGNVYVGHIMFFTVCDLSISLTYLLLTILVLQHAH